MHCVMSWNEEPVVCVQYFNGHTWTYCCAHCHVHWQTRGIVPELHPHFLCWHFREMSLTTKTNTKRLNDMLHPLTLCSCFNHFLFSQCMKARPLRSALLIRESFWCTCLFNRQQWFSHSCRVQMAHWKIQTRAFHLAERARIFSGFYGTC